MAFARALLRRHPSLFSSSFSAAAAPSLSSLFSSSSSSAAAPAPPQADPPEDSADKPAAAADTAPTSAPASRRKTKAVEKPMEIPYQAKVANVVHLIGSIAEPLVPVTTKDGITNAVSVLADRRDSEIPFFWIPIIFRGEQAEIAINHVKEKDKVYITGELCDCRHVPSDLSEAKINSTHQVLVHTLSFVKDFITNKKDNHPVVQSTSEEVKDPSNKPDDGNKSQKCPLAGPSVPIQKDIRDEPDQPIKKEKQNWPNPQGKGKQDKSGPWKDLIDNPHEWTDNRMKKQEGVVKPRFPDFSHKTTRKGVWINSLPESVLREINALFPTPGSEIEQGASTSTKPTFDAGSKFGRGENYTSNKPAFSSGSKFGQGTCTSNKPSFSFVRMPAQETYASNKPASGPSSKFEQGASTSKNSREELWRDLASNPDKWYDNRSTKLKPNHPDFKNKATGEALWLSSLPGWMNSKLPPLEAS